MYTIYNKVNRAHYVEAQDYFSNIANASKYATREQAAGAMKKIAPMYQRFCIIRKLRGAK